MLYILLPAYNEEKALPPLLEAVRETFLKAEEMYSVVVVDDGSTDGTAALVRRYSDSMPVILLSHGVNKGLGEAMKTGLSYLNGVTDQEDFIVALDADNTHNPWLIVNMVEKAREGYDVVIASRYAPDGREMGLAFYRKMLSRGASIVLSTFFPIPGVRDYTCGFRVYSANVIKWAFQVYGDLLIEEQGFVCMAEILIKLASLPARVAEVGLVLRYDLKEGTSKMKVGKTILGYFRLVAGLVSNRNPAQQGKMMGGDF